MLASAAEPGSCCGRAGVVSLASAAIRSRQVGGHIRQGGIPFAQPLGSCGGKSQPGNCLQRHPLDRPNHKLSLLRSQADLKVGASDPPVVNKQKGGSILSLGTVSLAFHTVRLLSCRIFAWISSTAITGVRVSRPPGGAGGSLKNLNDHEPPCEFVQCLFRLGTAGQQLCSRSPSYNVRWTCEVKCYS